MKSRPVLIIFSILAGLQILTSAGGLSEVVGPKVFFLFGLLVAAVQVGLTFYVQNSVVSGQEVAAYANADGVVVAGPAASVQNGEPVLVTENQQLLPIEGFAASFDPITLSSGSTTVEQVIAAGRAEGIEPHQLAQLLESLAGQLRSA